MGKQRDKMSPLLFAAMAAGGILAAWLLIIVAVVIIEKFEWETYPLILLRLWIPIVSTLLLTFLVSFVVARYYERVVITTLVVVGAVFILTSIKDTNFREIVFPVIDKSLDVNLLVAGITLFAFAIALGAVTVRHNSEKQSPESKFTIDVGTLIQRHRQYYRQYYRRNIRIERRYRKRIRRVKWGLLSI